MGARVKRAISKNFNRLSFHDAQLESVNLDFTNSHIEFSMQYIVDSIEESQGVFRPVYRFARLTLIGVYRLRMVGDLDPINQQIIFEFSLIEDSEDLSNAKKELNINDMALFHVYTSSNLSIDIFCKDFDFEFIDRPG